MKLLSLIAEDLAVPERVLEDALCQADRHYKLIRIPKRDGGTRTVIQPSVTLKLVQYWLMHNVFAKVPLHEAAMAYRPGLSIRDNAQRHRWGDFFLKMDLKHFFPSLRFHDIRMELQAWHAEAQPLWAWDDHTDYLLRHACFWRGESLAMGYPSSPVLSNIAMRGFDQAVSALLWERETDWGKVIYTRYADDLVFSCERPHTPGALIGALVALLARLDRPRLRINWSKRHLGSRAAGNTLITGVRCCQDRHLTLHRRYKDQARLLLSLLQKHALAKDDWPRLRGHLQHIHQIDPAFWYSLQGRYPDAFHQLGL